MRSPLLSVNLEATGERLLLKVTHSAITGIPLETTLETKVQRI